MLAPHGHTVSWVKKTPWLKIKCSRKLTLGLLGVRLLQSRLLQAPSCTPGAAPRLGGSPLFSANSFLLMDSCWWGNCERRSSSLCCTLFIHLPGDLEENSPVLSLCFIEMTPILQHLVCSTNVWGPSSNILNHDPPRSRTVRRQLA